MPAPSDSSPGLMRNLGAFFGHIARAVRTDPTPTGGDAQTTKVDHERIEVRRETETVHRGDVILRRTTIEEVEVRPAGTGQPPPTDSPTSAPTKGPDHAAD